MYVVYRCVHTLINHMYGDATLLYVALCDCVCIFRGGKGSSAVVAPQDLALLSVMLTEKRRDTESTSGWTRGTFRRRRAEIVYNASSSDGLAGEYSSTDDEVVRTVCDARERHDLVSLAGGKEGGGGVAGKRGRDGAGKGGRDGAGVKSLSSLFGSEAEAGLDLRIADLVGLKQLNNLARCTSARILVQTLTVDTMALDRLIISSSSNSSSRGLEAA